MKLPILFIAFLFFLSLNVSKAQNTHAKFLTPKQQSERTIQQLQVPLLLTDKQKNNLFNILLINNTKIDSLRIAKSSPDLIKAQYKIREQYVENLFTPEQLAKYQVWRKQQIKAMKK